MVRPNTIDLGEKRRNEFREGGSVVKGDFVIKGVALSSLIGLVFFIFYFYFLLFSGVVTAEICSTSKDRLLTVVKK